MIPPTNKDISEEVGVKLEEAIADAVAVAPSRKSHLHWHCVLIAKKYILSST